MDLSVKYFIGLLSLIQGLHFSDAQDTNAYNDPCIAKILSCDWYRQHFSLHKEKNIGMFTKIGDLQKACKEQVAFMRCIVRAENFCEQTNFLPRAKEMIKSRRFPAEVCRPGSPWQQLYLKEASCLNAYLRKVFEHCVDKVIGINNFNPDFTFEKDCKYIRTIVDCSVEALQEKCGYYAGNLLKKFFKFHILTDYKCSEFKPEDVEDYISSSTPVYDVTKSVFNVLEENDIVNESTNEADDVGPNFEQERLDSLESDDLKPTEVFTIFDFNPPPADETTVEYSFSDSNAESDKDSQETTTDPDEFEFSALPNYFYIHKNRTTFALYKDLEMGHMKYMGCGEADFFWIILSPLRSKYCTIADIKSEYSEVLFKCTVRIDAPCPQQLDEEDRSRKAEVFHRRYVITVLTPPNNQRSEDMAIMNVHYLKLYPSPSANVPEKKINLWTAEKNKANMESIGRKGSLETDDRNDVYYQHGNGSGQKQDKYTINSPTHSDDDESFDEYENWDYYAPEEEDIYFPELRANNIIYIEDDKGHLISLHDPRSPIYLKSVYQPNFLFRPSAGVMFASTDSQNFVEMGTNRRKKLVKRSIFKEGVSEFQDEALLSEVKPDQQEYCSAESPCAPNSEFISESGMKSGIYILSRNVKTFNPFKESQLYRKIPSSTKLEAIDLKPFLGFMDTYVVTPSDKIVVQESTESM